MNIDRMSGPPGGRMPMLAAALMLAGVATVAFTVITGSPRAGRDPTVAHVVVAEHETDVAATFLIEGRVAVQVPADWRVQRITTGPGSARAEVISPTDPETVLHVTQAVAPDTGLTGVAESIGQALRQAEADQPGVFVDFEPSGESAGRPAVTYREVRPQHRIEWTVLVDGAVRIGIGCQHRLDGDTDRPACDQAVRSARAVR